MSLGICAVLSGSSLLLKASARFIESENSMDPDETARMQRLHCINAGHIGKLLVFSSSGSYYYMCSQRKALFYFQFLLQITDSSTSKIDMNPLYKEIARTFKHKRNVLKQTNFEKFMVRQRNCRKKLLNPSLGMSKTRVYELKDEKLNTFKSDVEQTPIRTECELPVSDTFTRKLNEESCNIQDTGADREENNLFSVLESPKRLVVDYEKEDNVFVKVGNSLKMSASDVEDLGAGSDIGKPDQGSFTVVSIKNCQPYVSKFSAWRDERIKEKYETDQAMDITDLSQTDKAHLKESGVMLGSPKCQRESGHRGIEEALKFLSPIVSISCMSETGFKEDTSSPGTNTSSSLDVTMSSDSSVTTMPERPRKLRKRRAESYIIGQQKETSTQKCEVVHQSHPKKKKSEMGRIISHLNFPSSNQNNTEVTARDKECTEKIDTSHRCLKMEDMADSLFPADSVTEKSENEDFPSDENILIATPIESGFEKGCVLKNQFDEGCSYHLRKKSKVDYLGTKISRSYDSYLVKKGLSKNNEEMSVKNGNAENGVRSVPIVARGKFEKIKSVRSKRKQYSKRKIEHCEDMNTCVTNSSAQITDGNCVFESQGPMKKILKSSVENNCSILREKPSVETEMFSHSHDKNKNDTSYSQRNVTKNEYFTTDVDNFRSEEMLTVKNGTKFDENNNRINDKKGTPKENDKDLNFNPTGHNVTGYGEHTLHEQASFEIVTDNESPDSLLLENPFELDFSSPDIMKYNENYVTPPGKRDSDDNISVETVIVDDRGISEDINLDMTVHERKQLPDRKYLDEYVKYIDEYIPLETSLGRRKTAELNPLGISPDIRNSAEHISGVSSLDRRKSDEHTAVQMSPDRSNSDEHTPVQTSPNVWNTDEHTPVQTSPSVWNTDEHTPLGKLPYMKNSDELEGTLPDRKKSVELTPMVSLPGRRNFIENTSVTALHGIRPLLDRKYSDETLYVGSSTDEKDPIEDNFAITSPDERDTEEITTGVEKERVTSKSNASSTDVIKIGFELSPLKRIEESPLVTGNGDNLVGGCKTSVTVCNENKSNEKYTNKTVSIEMDDNEASRSSSYNVQHAEESFENIRPPLDSMSEETVEVVTVHNSKSVQTTLDKFFPVLKTVSIIKSANVNTKKDELETQIHKLMAKTMKDKDLVCEKISDEKVLYGTESVPMDNSERIEQECSVYENDKCMVEPDSSAGGHSTYCQKEEVKLTPNNECPSELSSLENGATFGSTGSDAVASKSKIENVLRQNMENLVEPDSSVSEHGAVLLEEGGGSTVNKESPVELDFVDGLGENDCHISRTKVNHDHERKQKEPEDGITVDRQEDKSKQQVHIEEMEFQLQEEEQQGLPDTFPVSSIHVQNTQSVEGLEEGEQSQDHRNTSPVNLQATLSSLDEALTQSSCKISAETLPLPEVKSWKEHEKPGTCGVCQHEFKNKRAQRTHVRYCKQQVHLEEMEFQLQEEEQQGLPDMFPVSSIHVQNTQGVEGLEEGERSQDHRNTSPVNLQATLSSLDEALTQSSCKISAETLPLPEVKSWKEHEKPGTCGLCQHEFKNKRAQRTHVRYCKQSASTNGERQKAEVIQPSNAQKETESLVTSTQEGSVEKSTEREEILSQQLNGGYSVGEVVWGKFSRNVWWPALVVIGNMIKRSTKKGCVWLYWLSDRQISQVKAPSVQPFQVKFISRYKQKRPGMQCGINKALEICASRANVDLREFGSIDAWTKSDKGFLQIDKERFRPDQEFPVPSYVLKDLKCTLECAQTAVVQKSKNKQNQGSRDTENTDNVVASTSCNQNLSTSVNLETSEVNCADPAMDVIEDEAENETERHNDFANEKTCIACRREVQGSCNHPLFKGKICGKCKENLKESFYAEDEDGCSMFCGVCGEGGNLYVCEDTECGKAFCFRCVERHTSPTTVKQIEETKHWKCFLCTKYSRLSHGDLVPQEDWSLEVVKLFQANNVPMCTGLQYLKNSGRRKIRVLSLFDGIGSGKVALDELGLDVDIYYASEINPDAMLVANFHHCPVQLGDIWNLNYTKLEELCPIDLVLAGPPCNDLSIVNPDRKGFNGTGLLVWRFVAVLKDIQTICKGTSHVFWLMENTGSMLNEYKEVISKQFEMQPVVWDAKYFTGQRRARNFWGNIPGMFSSPEFCKQLEKDKKDLDSVLISNCNRKARVSHTRTITSSSNSLTITNGVNNALVSMNGEPDHIWVQEIERLFGFPIHYTDVGQLTQERRRKLIGKAWSVPVIKHLLSPLKQYFKVKDT